MNDRRKTPLLRCTLVMLAVFWLAACKPWTLERLSEYHCQLSIEIFRDSLGNKLGQSEYFYNDHDSLIRIEHRDTLGMLIQYLTQEFNANDHLVEQASYEGDGSLNYRLEQDWENGRLARARQYDSDGQLEASIEYEYDQSGFLKQLRTVYAPSTVEIVYIENNSDGRPLRRVTIQESTGDTISIEEFAYDEYGNRVEYVLSGPNWTFETRITYAYDGAGHLVEWVVYRNDDETQRQEWIYEGGRNVGVIVSYNGAVIYRCINEFNHDDYVRQETKVDPAGKPLGHRDVDYICEDFPIH
jgi:YD repeat-containing protein